jgi:hypothetical protein
MPPRYAYWTILIDQKATAFRAREREELLPTFHQLKRKNTDVVMKWFARGRLWESPIEARPRLEARRRTSRSPRALQEAIATGAREPRALAPAREAGRSVPIAAMECQTRERTAAKQPSAPVLKARQAR